MEDFQTENFQMENFRNYYAILGVTREATPAEIKKAFRQLARQYHPDLNPGDREAEENFKRIGEAYEVLSDEERRSQYDHFSHYWQQEGFRAAGSEANRGTSWGRMADLDFSQFPDFNIFVDELLGQKPPEREAYEDSYGPGYGDYGSIGSDDRTESTPRTGADQTRYSQGAAAGMQNIEANLEVPLERAYRGGLERVRLEDGRAIELDMPGGLMSGQQIRLKGQGIGGGDLYLKVIVPPHPFYQLEGIDLYCRLPVTPVEAVLGAPVLVPTLDGPVEVQVPRGVRSGQRLRLARKGYPGEDGLRGDQIVEIALEVPPYLSEAEQELYEKLYQIESFEPRRELLL